MKCPVPFPPIYLARGWPVAPQTDANPNEIDLDEYSVTAGDSLKLRVAVDGGFVAQFEAAGI